MVFHIMCVILFTISAVCNFISGNHTSGWVNIITVVLWSVITVFDIKNLKKFK